MTLAEHDPLPTLRQRLAELSIVVDTNRQLAATLELDEIEKVLFQTIMQVTGAQRCVLVLADQWPDCCRISMPDDAFQVQTGNPVPTCPARKVLHERKTIIMDGSQVIGEDVMPCPAIEEGLTSYVGVPLTVGGEVIGLLEALNLAEPKNSEQQVELLSAVADSASLAIQNALFYSQLYQEKQRIEDLEATMKRLLITYLPSPVADMLVDDPQQAKLGGERKDVTILFADLEGFTQFSEHRPPEDVIMHLNQVLDGMIEEVTSRGGIPAAFIGDGIMAMFNAPIPLEGHVSQAVKAAIALQDWVVKTNSDLCVNIGIQTGEVVVGNIGSQSLRAYTAIGDTVNVASRLQDLAHNGQILVSGSVHDRLDGQMPTEFLGEQPVEGRQQPVRVYRVMR